MSLDLFSACYWRLVCLLWLVGIDPSFWVKVVRNQPISALSELLNLQRPHRAGLTRLWLASGDQPCQQPTS